MVHPTTCSAPVGPEDVPRHGAPVTAADDPGDANPRAGEPAAAWEILDDRDPEVLGAGDVPLPEAEADVAPEHGDQAGAPED